MNSLTPKQKNLIWQYKNCRLKSLEEITAIEKTFVKMIDNIDTPQNLFSTNQLKLLAIPKEGLKKTAKLIFEDMRQQELEIEKLFNRLVEEKTK